MVGMTSAVLERMEKDCRVTGAGSWSKTFLGGLLSAVLDRHRFSMESLDSCRQKFTNSPAPPYCDAFGHIGTAFRALEWKTLVFSGTAGRGTPNAP